MVNEFIQYKDKWIGDDKEPTVSIVSAGHFYSAMTLLPTNLTSNKREVFRRREILTPLIQFLPNYEEGEGEDGDGDGDGERFDHW